MRYMWSALRTARSRRDHGALFAVCWRIVRRWPSLAASKSLRLQSPVLAVAEKLSVSAMSFTVEADFSDSDASAVVRAWAATDGPQRLLVCQGGGPMLVNAVLAALRV